MARLILISFIVLLSGCGETEKTTTLPIVSTPSVRIEPSALCVGQPANTVLNDGCNSFTCNENGEISYQTLISCDL